MVNSVRHLKETFLKGIFVVARAKRLDIVGFYHIINRGVERRAIYLESQDYDFFMTLLLKMKKDFDLNIHTFCLMTNHYHILLETKKENLSKAVQFLQQHYSVRHY